MIMETSRSYRDLRVWKEAVGLVKDIYQATAQFPATETYGLTSQIRKAAVSIPSNIAEGQGRNSSGEFRQFLGVSLGSIAEVETQLIISKEIGYFAPKELDRYLSRLDDLRKMLKSLSLSLK